MSIGTSISDYPSFAYVTGTAAKGLAWYVTFAPSAGDVSSLIVSTGNGPESILASAGTLTGTHQLVSVAESVKGGLLRNMVSFQWYKKLIVCSTKFAQRVVVMYVN